MEAHTSAKEDSSNNVPLSESRQELNKNNPSCEQCKLADNHFQTLDVAEPHKKADEKVSLFPSLRRNLSVLRNHRGLVYVSMSSVSYALLGVFAKLCTSVHAYQIGVVRGVFLCYFSCLGVLYKRTILNYTKREMSWIVLLACSNGFAQIAIFNACKLTSVGNASAILYSIPALTGVAAWIFLKEPLTCVDIIMTVMCTVGIFLISKPSFIFGSSDTDEAKNHFIGSLWAVGGLLAMTVVCIFTRKLSFSASDVYTLTLSHGIVSTCASAILNSLIGKWSCPGEMSEILYLMGVGVVGFSGIYLYNLSLETENALVSSIVFSSTVFISYVFQFAIFHQFPDFVTGIGIALLMTSVFVVFFRDWKESRSLRENQQCN